MRMASPHISPGFVAGTASGEEEAEEEQRFVENHRSPGLKAALASIPADGTCRILDLGPSVAGNLEFVSSLASRVQIVDLLGGDTLTGKTAYPGHRERVGVLSALADEHADSFPLVLVWDTFSYLPIEQAQAVVGELARLCRPDGRLLAIIVEADTMPASPNIYRIIDEESLAYELRTTDIRGGPQLPPAAVERLLAGFSIEHSYVLRHGVREYLAVRRKLGS